MPSKAPHDANRQIVFIDTPGYLKPRYEMQTRMLKIWSDAFKDVDLIVFMTDIAKFPTEYDKEVLSILKSIKNPQLAVFNKIDRSIEYDESILKASLPDSINEALFISALRGDNVEELVSTIDKYLPFHEPYYSEEDLSDLPMRFFAQETIARNLQTI